MRENDARSGMRDAGWQKNARKNSSAGSVVEKDGWDLLLSTSLSFSASCMFHSSSPDFICLLASVDESSTSRSTYEELFVLHFLIQTMENLGLYLNNNL